MTVQKNYIAPISNGLGDLICSLPVIAASIKSGAETYLVLRSRAQVGLESRIVGLTGTINESDLADLADDGRSRIINLRNHPLQTDHVWGSEQFMHDYPDLCIDDIICTVAGDFDLQIDSDCFRALSHRADGRAVDKILFIPASRGSQKCWSSDNWLKLAENLAGENVKIAILGQPDIDPSVAQLIEKGLQWLPTKTLEEAVDAVSSARAVVGVDTGLMHLAVHQHIPTVALFRYNAVFARKKANVLSIKAPRCPQACLKAEFDTDCHKKLTFEKDESGADSFYWSSWHCLQKAEDHCMAQINCDQVFQALKQLQLLKQ